jgi:hypothetical protein
MTPMKNTKNLQKFMQIITTQPTRRKRIELDENMKAKIPNHGYCPGLRRPVHGNKKCAI